MCIRFVFTYYMVRSKNRKPKQEIRKKVKRKKIRSNLSASVFDCIYYYLFSPIRRDQIAKNTRQKTMSIGISKIL